MHVSSVYIFEFLKLFFLKNYFNIWQNYVRKTTIFHNIIEIKVSLGVLNGAWSFLNERSLEITAPVALINWYDLRIGYRLRQNGVKVKLILF